MLLELFSLLYLLVIIFLETLTLSGHRFLELVMLILKLGEFALFSFKPIRGDLLNLLSLCQMSIQFFDLLVVGLERLAILGHDRAEIDYAIVGLGQCVQLIRRELMSWG